MQDLRPIRVFLEVAAQRSFARAARQLAMTPASVTRIVARLEQDLGQQLLTRTTRTVALTTAGAMVAARYQAVVEEFDRITGEITRATRPDQGRLSINAPISLGVRLLPRLVESFSLAYPNIALDLQMTDRLVDIVQESCDLAIRISGPPADKSTIWRKLCEVPRQVVAAPALFQHLRRPETPDDLQPDWCLSYGTEGQPETWRFQRAGLRRTIRAGSRIVANNGEFLKEMAIGGQGLVNLPRFITAPAVAAGQLEPVLTDWALPPLWLTLYYPPYEALPPLVATFTDFFEAWIRDFEGLDFGRG